MLLSRREFISLSLSTLYLLTHNLEVLASDAVEIFDLGIASGDPTQDGIVLWTRINPNIHSKLNKDLILEISQSPEMKESSVIKIPGDKIIKERDYTIRLTIDNLKPGQTYYYRFTYADVPSMIGRFKTLPVGDVENYKVGFVTCQNYADGYYTAYRHLANEDIGFILHLGDQIYERIYGKPRVPGRDLAFPSGHSIALDLEDYKYLYTTYLSDKDYQLARAMHPFIYIWDDHEYANDYSFDYEKGFYKLPKHPFENDREKVLNLRKAAILAWYFYTPSRAKLNLNAQNPLKWIAIYRDFKIGELAHLICLDERSYRTPQPCDKRYVSAGCEDQYKTSILGENQKFWFYEKLKQGNSWKIVANEVQFVQGKINGLYGSLDAWDGYIKERQEIIEFLNKNNINKFVALTGDRHAGLVAEIPTEFKENYEKIVGVEFMTPAISSISAAEANWWQDYGVKDADEYAQLEIKQNPWTKYLSHRVWGYSILDIDKSSAKCQIVSVDKYKKDSDKEIAATYQYIPGKGLMKF
jgi:alkaline phosphatase D